MIAIEINDQKTAAAGDKTILEAALDAGIYIPHICYHPQLAPSSKIGSLKKVFPGGSAHHGEEGASFEGCNLCLVEIRGREGLFQSCGTIAEDGMSIRTDSSELQKAREENLARILESHPHACLVCEQAEGCDRKLCSIHVPEPERCCFKFGICELQKLTEFIGVGKGLPPYQPLDVPVVDSEPLIRRDYNLCIGCMRCVRVCKEVIGVDALGFTVEKSKVLVGSKGPTLAESGCRFCGFCVEICPTGALADKEVRAGKRERSLVPCKSLCPAEINVPEYIRFIKEGEFEKALRVIYAKVPFPEVLGRVCFKPCETGCRRRTLDQPVAICALKRAAADQSNELDIHTPIKEKTGKRVAVIGSGPAGLTAAYYLSTLGHSITVFETLPEAGGMLRVGIPAFRLPRDVLDREIKRLEDARVEIRTNHRIDSIDELTSDGFGAIFVAVGNHKGLKLGVPGEESGYVLEGVNFLRGENLGQEVPIGKRVAVVGGGNVATDSARSLLRKGARDVTIFYRRTRDEMPAYDEEIEAVLEEGAKIEYRVAPKSIKEVDGAVEIEFIRMRMGGPDPSKRRRPIPIEGSEFKLEVDVVISAIGQRADVPVGANIPVHSGTELNVNPAEGIFIGGDLLTGPKTVIDAIAGGRKGARLVDKYLGGDGNIDKVFTGSEGAHPGAGPESVYMDQGRIPMPMLPVKERTCNFLEVHLGFDKSLAIREAKRCLGCDLRFQMAPVVLPPEQWLILSEENIQGLPEEEGVYLLYDEQKEVYKICGVENIREALFEENKAESVARYFDYEEDLMFTTKERQLIQQYVKKNGVMPPGNDEMDDLY